jgi:hypothetical protein
MEKVLALCLSKSSCGKMSLYVSGQLRDPPGGGGLVAKSFWGLIGVARDPPFFQAPLQLPPVPRI